MDASTGNLYYGQYSNQGQANSVHIIPDFSYVGYMGGGVDLPEQNTIAVQVTLFPELGDAYSRIQDAIDQVSQSAPDQRGIRGAVLLRAGLYEISQALIIAQDGVVLRGEGQGADGTVISSLSRSIQDSLLLIQGDDNARLPRESTDSRRTRIASDYVAVGTTIFEVDSTTGYQVGDNIAVVRTPNANWVSSNGIDTARYGWDASTYDVALETKITAIDNNYIAVEIPLLDTIEDQFGGGEVYRIDTSARLQQVGVEGLRLEGLQLADPSDLSRAFFGIQWDEVENSWVRDVTLRYVSHAFVFNDGSRNITAQNLAHIDPDFEVIGGRHYAFAINGGQRILVQRCFAHQSRHTMSSGSRVSGPNVFLDCLADDSQSDSGPHHRWATGTLYDNTKGVQLRVQNRRTAGTGHGWAGAQQMFWNTDHLSNVVQAPLGAMNWAVGMIGVIEAGQWQPEESQGIIESFNSAVQPRSLYLQQLEDRLGNQAVDNVTVPAQRQGTIWLALGQWRGEGDVDGDRIISDDDQ